MTFDYFALRVMAFGWTIATLSWLVFISASLYITACIIKQLTSR